MRGLIVEDDHRLSASVRRGLEDAGFVTDSVFDGEEAVTAALTTSYDVILLDVMLPKIDGIEVSRLLRRRRMHAPILMLTARDSIDDRVLGLEAGADDYLVKPFAFAELLARLRVLLRRGAGERETVLRADDLEMDLLGRRVTRGGAEIGLAVREFEVLEYLLRHKNAVVTREMLGRDVWKEPGYALTNVIDVYINFLRRKLERTGGRPLIHTVRGVGYCLKE